MPRSMDVDTMRDRPARPPAVIPTRRWRPFPRRALPLVFCSIVAAGPPPVCAATHDVAPRGSGGGADLRQVLDGGVAKAGDTIRLRTGYYGDLAIVGRRNARPITIVAAPGAAPRFASIRIRASANWRLVGLHVSPSVATGRRGAPMVRIENDSDDIAIENSTLFSVPDVSRWTAADWNVRASNAVQAGGRRITLRRNRIRNVNHGIVVAAAGALVEGNVIENFSGDGIRILGNHGTYRSNTIKNCYKVNGNHDDGIQSWTRGVDGRVGTGEVVGVRVTGNRIVNYEDPDQPFHCTLQGIGLFDGTFVDWVIDNNVVIVDHWHGITVMGARNVRIVNNTVLDPNATRPGPPWITITPHKNGTPPTGSVIANNLAPSFNPRGNRTFFATSRTGVVMRGNLVVRDAARFFVDPGAGDLRLRPDSPALGAAAPAFAPADDIAGHARPAGGGVDAGAFQR